MQNKDVERYLKETNQGLETIRKYGNWSVPPWMIKKFGFEAVSKDLQMRAGQQYTLRRAVYKLAAKNSKKNEYFIFEKKPD